MNDKQADIEKAFEVLDASARLCDGLKETYLKCLKDYQRLKSQSAQKAELDDALHLCMKYGFGYLKEKFHFSWFTTEKDELIFRHYRPNWDYFNAMDFELLVQSVLYFIEDKEYKLTQASHDKGIDLYHEEQFLVGGSSVGIARTVVQCKLYHESVSVSDIRDFFGVITAQVALGYFFTTGKLSSAGVRFVESANRSSFANRFRFIGREGFKELVELTSVIVECWDDYEQISSDDEDEEEEKEVWSRMDAAKARAAFIIQSPPYLNPQPSLF